MSAPMDIGRTVKLFLNLWVLWNFSLFLKAQEDEADKSDDFLLCRHCGHEIVKAEDLIRKPSSLAMRQRNDTILGVKAVLIQLFENPQGSRFEVITSKKADVFNQEQAFAEHSWFPGFTWKISFCPRCGTHLGWHFEPPGHKHTDGSDDQVTFTGLILNNLLHNQYADSLLITPKSYHS